MSEEKYPKLLFPLGFDGAIAFEAEAKGWYYHAEVQLSREERVRVAFCDSYVIAQELDRGEPCVAVPGMIVIPKVTLENMRRAVSVLSEGDFFDELKARPGG